MHVWGGGTEEKMIDFIVTVAIGIICSVIAIILICGGSKDD